MPRHKEPLFTREELVDLYVTKRLSTLKIGKLRGCSATSVSYYLVKFDIPRRGKITPDAHFILAKYVTDKLSIRNISRTYGIHRTRVAEILKENGVYIRDTSKENCHLWRGGITKLSTQIRNSTEMKKWKKDILERDNFTCTLCGAYGVDFHVDHIVPLSFLLRNIASMEEALSSEKIWDLTNGRTLCIPCHKGTDTFAYKAITYGL